MGRHQHAMPSGPVDPSFPWTDSAEIPASGSTTVRFPTRPGRHVAFDEPLDARRSPTGGHLSTGPAGRRSSTGPSRRREVHAVEGQARAGTGSGDPAPTPGVVGRRAPARPGSVVASRRRTTDGPGSAGQQAEHGAGASSDPDGPAGEPDPGESRSGEPSDQAPSGRLPPAEIPTRDLPVRAGARNGSVRTRRTGEAAADPDQASEPAAPGRDSPGSPGMRARRVVVTGPVDLDVPSLPVRPRPTTDPKRTVVEYVDPDRPDLDTLRRVLAALHRL